MSTLAEDQAKAANQGKPGYDVLGNPITAASTPPQTSIPSPTTPSSTTSDPSVPSPYYSRYATAGEKAAQSFIDTFQAPQSEEDIAARKTKAAQAQIDSLNSYYDSLLSEQQVVNDKRDRQTNALSVLTGLAGSTEANTAASETTALNQKDIEKIQNERAVAVQGVLADIRKSAATEAQQSREDARKSAEDILAQKTARQTEAVSHLTNLAKAGTTTEGLKATDPTAYKYLVDNVGGEDQLKALFTLNRPAESIIDKQIKDGKYIIAYQNPLTGKTRIETVDLGLPTGYSKTVDAGDRILAIPDNWDGDPNKLITINKGLTPDQAAKNAGGGAPAGYNGEFAATIDLAAQAGTTNAQRTQIKQNLQEFIGNGDYKSAWTQILQAASSKLTGANASNFQQQQQSYSALTDMAQALKDYQAAGGDTNIFKGGVDKIQTKIGALLTDPKYAALATRLDSAFQQYRQNMTGAAFGAKESSEYASVLPSSGNTFALNMAKIDGAQQYLNTVIESTVRNTIGQGGVEIKHYAEGATPRTSSTGSTKVLVKDGQAFDAADLTPEEYQQALADGYQPQ